MFQKVNWMRGGGRNSERQRWKKTSMEKNLTRMGKLREIKISLTCQAKYQYNTTNNNNKKNAKQWWKQI